MNKITDAVENITFRRTTYEGGKHMIKSVWHSEMTLHNHKVQVSKNVFTVSDTERDTDTDKEWLVLKYVEMFTLHRNRCQH